MSHVTHIDESCAEPLFWDMATPYVSLALSNADFVTRHMNVLYNTYEWVKPYLWMRHATLIDESLYTYGWVMCCASFLGHGYSCCVAFHVYCKLRHATREWVVRHIWMSQAIHMNTTSHRLSHVTHMNESCAALLFWDMAAPAVSFTLPTADFGMRHVSVCSSWAGVDVSSSLD